MATRMPGNPAIQEPRAAQGAAAVPDLRALQVTIQNIRERFRLLEQVLMPVIAAGEESAQSVVRSIQAGVGGATLNGRLVLSAGSGIVISSNGNIIQLSGSATAGVNSLNDLQGDIDIEGFGGIGVDVIGQTIRLSGGGGGGMVPFFIPAAETFVVPPNKQALFTIPIDVEGIMDIEGVLVEVD